MRGYKSSKAPLALMEQSIMILVFALASAVCLQAFVYSNRLSKEGDRTEKAMNKAQTVIEYCKSNQGNLDKVCEILGGKRRDDGLALTYKEEEMELTLWLTGGTDYIEKALIIVCEPDGEEIYRTETAWQKE